MHLQSKKTFGTEYNSEEYKKQSEINVKSSESPESPNLAPPRPPILSPFAGNRSRTLAFNALSANTSRSFNTTMLTEIMSMMSVNSTQESSPPGLSEAIEQLRASAKRKLQDMFSLEDDAASKSESTKRITEDVIKGNGLNSLSDRMTDVLIHLDMDSRRTHPLLPFGRGNIDVKEEDALHPKEESVVSPEVAEMEFAQYEPLVSKNFLSMLGQHLTDTVKTLDDFNASHEAIQTAGSALFTGCGWCHHYACVSALRIAHRYAALIESGEMSLSVISLESEDKENNFDHAVCKVEFENRTIIIDSWADHNEPKFWEKTDFAARKTQILHVIHPDSDAQTHIAKAIDNAANAAEELMMSNGFKNTRRNWDAKIIMNNVIKKKPRNDGIYDMPLNGAVESWQQPAQRRPSITSTREHPLAPYMPSFK